jgi:3-methyladenine DNA glycosylase AlkD
MSDLVSLKRELQQLADVEQQVVLQRFFKTGAGEYAEGDVFLGIKVPVLRKIAKKYASLSLTEIEQLLQSQFHEYRFLALVLLINRYYKAQASEQSELFEFYLSHIALINNWDLVDISAPHIIGEYLLNKPRDVLYQLAHSSYLWRKRIAIVATKTFIKYHQFQDTLQIAEILLADSHDLIYKAVGWMLREVGKRDQAMLESFLQQHASIMPRTMLRYAIEKFEPEKRRFYLTLKS